MNLLEIFLVGIGLSMDAFAVSICKGLSMNRMNWKSAGIIALYFGFFQAFMPLVGYFLSSTFQELLISIEHFIAFFLLILIGGKMVKDSFKKDSKIENNDVGFKSMTLLAIATSLDALAVGITFGVLKNNIFLAISIIGLVTYIISLIGVKIGNQFGDRFNYKTELIGGIIIILIGIKILVEHLGIV